MFDSQLKTLVLSSVPVQVVMTSRASCTFSFSLINTWSMFPGCSRLSGISLQGCFDLGGQHNRVWLWLSFCTFPCAIWHRLWLVVHRFQGLILMNAFQGSLASSAWVSSFLGHQGRSSFTGVTYYTSHTPATVCWDCVTTDISTTTRNET